MNRPKTQNWRVLKNVFLPNLYFKILITIRSEETMEGEKEGGKGKSLQLS